MAGRHSRRAEPGNRAESQRHDRNPPEIGGRVIVGEVRTDPPRQVGAPGCLDRLDRTAAARALDNADDRQAQIMRHLLRHQRLLADRRIGRPAAHREIVARDDDRAAVDRRPAKHVVRRGQFDQIPVLVVPRLACNRADLVKAGTIDQSGDALAHGQLAGVVLALDPLGPAKLAHLPLAFAQLVQFRLPAHARSSVRFVPGQSIAACDCGPSR